MKFNITELNLNVIINTEEPKAKTKSLEAEKTYTHFATPVANVYETKSVDTKTEEEGEVETETEVVETEDKVETETEVVETEDQVETETEVVETEDKVETETEVVETEDQVETETEVVETEAEAEIDTETVTEQYRLPEGYFRKDIIMIFRDLDPEILKDALLKALSK